MEPNTIYTTWCRQAAYIRILSLSTLGNDDVRRIAQIKDPYKCYLAIKELSSQQSKDSYANVFRQERTLTYKPSMLAQDFVSSFERPLSDFIQLDPSLILVLLQFRHFVDAVSRHPHTPEHLGIRPQSLKYHAHSLSLAS